MDAANLCFIVSVICAALCAFIVVPQIVVSLEAFVSNVHLRQRLRGDITNTQEANGLEGVQNFVVTVVEGGIPALQKPAQRLMNFGLVSARAADIARLLAMRNISATSQTVVQCAIPVIAISAALLSLLFSSVTLGLLTCFLLVCLAASAISHKIERANSEFTLELPDALRAIGIYYESGMSLVQAFEQVAQEVLPPLSQELAQAVADMKTGTSSEDALQRLRDRVHNQTLDFVTVSLEVQKRTGGALRPLLERAARGVSDNLEMQRFLSVQTAQARLSSGIVAIMPIVIFLFMALINPEYAQGFFSSALGIGLFILACVLDCVGVLMIRRILNIAGRW